MTLPPSLETSMSQQVSTYEVQTYRPKAVIIASIIGLIIGLMVLATGLTLLAIYSTQLSMIFSLLVGCVMVGVVLLLMIGGAFTSIIFKLINVRKKEVEQAASSIKNLQDQLLVKDKILGDVQDVLDKKDAKTRAILQEKNEELDCWLKRCADVNAENERLDRLVVSLRSELACLKKAVGEAEETNQRILASLQLQNNFLLAQTASLSDSLDTERTISASLRSQMGSLETSVERKTNELNSKESRIASLKEEIDILKLEITGLQKYISDNVVNKDTSSSSTDG
ncbi:hypothetical protein [Chlamydia vaughanii]|uniref:hypothetical protein n=1 Tax=Chlamydia vaughanii TaxID=3112552 RepID=UPI0032B15329